MTAVLAREMVPEVEIGPPARPTPVKMVQTLPSGWSTHSRPEGEREFAVRTRPLTPRLRAVKVPEPVPARSSPKPVKAEQGTF
jgi:hypothetical protein